MSTTAPRVAIVSHGHPEFSKGGTEQASYSLFRNLKERGAVDPVYLAQCLPRNLGHAGDFALFRGRPDEILWSPPAMDWFRLVSTAPALLRRQLREFVERTEPDLVHLHHYVGAGSELIRILKDDLRRPIVLTLHEYIAICNNQGQMIKTDGRLCEASSYAECSACFPEWSSGKFFLRKAMLLDSFARVDQFIAPSAFLAERYAAWGIAPDRIKVIENPLRETVTPSGPVFGDRAVAGRSQIRLAYFGQLNPFKGVDVLLDAIEALDDETREKVRVSFFGFRPNRGGSDFERRMAMRLDTLKPHVVTRGIYRNENVLDLMQSFDWIVVPSVWWENSPVVIQEARTAGVPVLCSNIGGMREKVRPGVDGAHFMAGDSNDLAAKITAICSGELKVALPAAREIRSRTEEIVNVYRAVLAPGAVGRA